MPTSEPRRRLAAGILLLTAALATALGACADGSRPGVPRAFDAAKAAARVRDLGLIATTGRVRYSDRSGPMTGRIAYDPYRFRIRTTIPTGRSRRPTTFTGVGDRAWVTHAVVAGSDATPVSGPLLLVLRSAQAPPTLELPAAPGRSPWIFTSMLDPARVLTEVARTGTPFETARPATIDGVERAGRRAVVSRSDARTTGLRRVTVWVDPSGLPLRLAVVTAAQGEARYDIRRGHGPLRVGAPAGSPAPDATRTAAPDATGTYTTVVETTAAGIPVRVLSAPADAGWTCWKVDSEPPFRGLADARPSGGTCTAPVQAAGTPEDEYAIPLMAAAGTPYALLGLVVPPGSVVEFRRFGAEPVTTTAGPTGLALYVGPSEPILGLAIVTTPEASLVCGPVGIDNESDFVARQDGGEANRDLLGAPWSCLSAADADALGG